MFMKNCLLRRTVLITLKVKKKNFFKQNNKPLIRVRDLNSISKQNNLNSKLLELKLHPFHSFGLSFIHFPTGNVFKIKGKNL